MVKMHKHCSPTSHKRRARKPRIDTMIAQAERAGKNVASITTPEGYTITFGQPGADNVKPNGNGAAASLDGLDRELKEFEARHGKG
jgi:hypothetical protein